MKINIKKLCADAKIPKAMTAHAAGHDLYAANDTPITIPPAGIQLVPTGIAIAVPDGYEAQVRPRSGLALHHGIGILNAPGTIDADYRGEIGIILFNFGKADFVVSTGMRIAQLIVAKCEKIEFVPVDELDNTQRGAGGFGHTLNK